MRMTNVGAARVYQSTVAKIEKGGRPLRVNELDVLARVFGTSLAALVDQSTQSPREVALEVIERRQAELDAAKRRLEAAEAGLEKATEMVEVATVKLATAEIALGRLLHEEEGKAMAPIGDYWSKLQGGQGDGEPREEG